MYQERSQQHEILNKFQVLVALCNFVYKLQKKKETFLLSFSAKNTRAVYNGVQLFTFSESSNHAHAPIGIYRRERERERESECRRDSNFTSKFFRCPTPTSIFPQIYRAKLIQIARRSGGRIPMRLCIINYGTRCAGPPGTFTRENARPPLLAPRSLGKIQSIFHDRGQCRSRANMLARQIRTITSHLRRRCEMCKCVANTDANHCANWLSYDRYRL